MLSSHFRLLFTLKFMLKKFCLNNWLHTTETRKRKGNEIKKAAFLYTLESVTEWVVQVFDLFQSV